VTANARRAPRAAAGILTAVVLSRGLACASYSDALARGQRYYEDNQYERALALWRDLDRREAQFSPAERARYAYFRGMTDYRLGYRDDARHWLAIARAADSVRPGGLGAVWLERLDTALADLGQSPSRSNATDVVQTIEAPPGVLPPDEPASDSAPGGAVSGGFVAGEPAPPRSTPPESDAGANPAP
jgi:hypothetical protein